MGSRKRRHSYVSVFQQESNKREKLPSNIWRGEKEVLESQVSQSSVYTINGIIGEREDGYLVDWKNNSTTGERYLPDWVRTPFQCGSGL